jgi:hypothetical protein
MDSGVLLNPCTWPSFRLHLFTPILRHVVEDKSFGNRCLWCARLYFL